MKNTTQTRTEGNEAMRITIETSCYNERRYGKPWIAKVSKWDNGRPALDWGDWNGAHGDAGTLEINADPGDINWATREEALKIMSGGGARISR